MVGTLQLNLHLHHALQQLPGLFVSACSTRPPDHRSHGWRFFSSQNIRRHGIAHTMMFLSQKPGYKIGIILLSMDPAGGIKRAGHQGKFAQGVECPRNVLVHCPLSACDSHAQNKIAGKWWIRGFVVWKPRSWQSLDNPCR